MTLFKFLFYGLGFMIGLTFAFCKNTDYDNHRFYVTSPVELPPVIDIITPEKVESSISQKGKALFKSNCAACHNKNMRDDMTGPALRGTLERWKGREDLLYDWIRNSQALIATGDAYAVNLYNQYNKSVMTAFPNLKDEEITSILEYIEAVP